jgi:type I restriction enzyme M protein
MLEPYKGRVYDPCCGSGGMFVQSEKFIEEHQGRINDVSIFGQESNPTTWKLAKMNMAIRGIDSNIALGDTFHNDQHKDLKANFIIANPPFNISDWGGERLRDDPRWRYGVPPTGNANFAWVQHMIYHLAPDGTMGIVLANGSMSSNSSGEGDIRKNLIENDLVDCMVALPSQLFYNTMIPACLWFIRRNRANRTGQILFIDARKMGEMISRKNRALTTEDVQKIADTYHNWKKGEEVDELGFAKSASREEVEKHNFILTPGRYVGIEEEEDDGIPFEDKMAELTTELAKQMEEGKRLDEEIKSNLKSIGFDL